MQNNGYDQGLFDYQISRMQGIDGALTEGANSADVTAGSFATEALAAVASGVIGMVRNAKGADVHHIMTNKNEISEAAGGPYTPEFEALAAKRGITLEDEMNKMRLPGHRGPHPRYNAAVYERLMGATRGVDCEKFNGAFDEALQNIRKETATPGTTLNELATGGGG